MGNPNRRSRYERVTHTLPQPQDLNSNLDRDAHRQIHESRPRPAFHPRQGPANLSKTSIIKAVDHKKDVIISSNGVEHNIVRSNLLQEPNGYIHRELDERDEFKNLISYLGRMKAEEKIRFWKKNHVEIEIGINYSPQDLYKILDSIKQLGPEFLYVKGIFINLYEGSYEIPVGIEFLRESNIYNFLETLVDHLCGLKSVRTLQVNFRKRDKLELSNTDLNLFLPFYDLKYRRWSMNSQPQTQNEWVPAGEAETRYLNRERTEILRQRREKERAARKQASKPTHIIPGSSIIHNV